MVGGGEIPPEACAQALEYTSEIVAADGGARYALENGQEPAAVLGDFDSLTEDIRQRLPRENLHLIPEQQTTDFDKGVRNVDAPYALAVAFTGARQDHELSAYHVLVRSPWRALHLLGQP